MKSVRWQFQTETCLIIEKTVDLSKTLYEQHVTSLLEGKRRVLSCISKKC